MYVTRTHKSCSYVRSLTNPVNAETLFAICNSPILYDTYWIQILKVTYKVRNPNQIDLSHLILSI
jgi:hypothetical protein